MLLQDLINLCIYMDYLIVISNDTFEKNIDILDDALLCLINFGHQFNAVK